MRTRPVQVYLDEQELERLDGWARARGWTKSQALRAAIRALVRSDGDPRESPLLALSGMVADGLPSDLSENFDRYLSETYVAEGRVAYRRASPVRQHRRRS